ncbi:MAG: TRAP transporter large permease subunit [Rhodospirillales bacterium]
MTSSVAAHAAPAPPLERLQEACAAATRPIAFLGVIGMLIVSGVTVADVLLRWLANSGVAALNEVVSMTFAVAVAACMPSGCARGVNLTVDILERWLAPRLAAWLAAAGSVLLFVFFAVLAWRIGVFARSVADQGLITIILNWPQAPFLYAAAILIGIAAVVQAVAAANLVRRAMACPAGPLPPTASRTVSNVVIAAAVAIVALAGYAALDFAAVARWTQSAPGTTVAVAFALLWACLLGLVPLAAVMGLMGIAGSALFIGFGPAFSAFATEAAGFLTNSQVATLPLFLMMGSFAAVAGVSNDVYRLAQAFVGLFRGGLAMATVGGCAGFGAVTGSSLATVATFGRVALPEMRARGYAPGLATGCVAAGGTLGALIPPSAPLIVFALLTEASIGQLFVAALVPGVIAMALYLATIGILVRIDPDIAPPPVRMRAQEFVAALRQCGAVALLFGGVIGGMYGGVFTATEAAAVGAFGAFLVALARGKLRPATFWSVMGETTGSTALIYGLIFGALSFSFFVGISAIPEHAMALVGGLALEPVLVIALLLLVYLVLGCVMDSFAVMVITVPIVTPLILNMGYDMVWWGIVMLCVVETGMITPPFGLNVYVLKTMVDDVPMGRIFRGVVPFVAADFIKLALLVAIPAIVLWLPSTMYR